MTHRYAVGQYVFFEGSFGPTLGPIGSYKIIRLVPIENDDKIAYRIKSPGEAFERVAEEHQLTAVQDNEPQLVDTTDLTDADWVEINKIKQACAKNGARGFEKALNALYKKDQLTWLRVVVAYTNTTREALGVTAEDLEAIFGEMECAPTKH